MKNTIRKTFFILISFVLLLNIPLYSNAFSIDSIFEDGKSFINEGASSNAEGITDEELKPISNTVSNILLTIAIGVTLISAAVMAINFMIQSVEDKAKVKESMVPWIIGIFISFGAYGIWQITMNIFYEVNSKI